MKRGKWADELDALHDAAVDGVVRTSHLIDLGVTSPTIVRRCLPKGPWQRLLPGIVLLHNGNATEHQRAVAAISFAGGTAMLTGASGLNHLGYGPAVTPVHVLVRHDVRRQSAGYTIIERTHRLPKPLMRRGIPIAPLTRCVIDAARRSRNARWCLDVMARAVQRGETSVDELAIELAECTTRGTAIPRRQLRQLGSGAHSIAEADAHALFAAANLPEMVANCDIVDASGLFIARPDGWIDDVGLAWEIDSMAHHLDVADHERTMHRRSLMQTYGIVVVSHLPKTIRDSPDSVIAELRAAYVTASKRPRPAVRMAHPAARSALASD